MEKLPEIPQSLIDVLPPKPPFHPRLERRLHLIEIEEDIIASRGRKLPDFHPFNDEHTKAIVDTVEAFTALKPQLKESDYYVLLHLIKDTPFDKIEEEFKYKLTPEVVESARHTPEIREAYALLTTIQGLHRGTTRRNRADLLWRVAVRSEAKRPDIAIAAVNAINKMDVEDKMMEPGLNGVSSRPALTIVVSNPALLKAPLDIEEATVVETS